MEEPLTGGNVGGAVRAGDTVRRPAGPWTPAVHALLHHLERRGLDGVPHARGLDEQGREILTYLPGMTVGATPGEAWPSWVWSDALLVDTMRWLRRYHDAVRDFRPDAALRWRLVARTLRPDEIVCHNDVAPYNVVVDPGSHRLTGVIDWDVAGPGRPADDLGFAAWSFVPCWRPMPTAEVARRIRLMATAYGVTPPTVLHAIAPRMTTAVRRIRRGAAQGDPGMRRLVEGGQAERTERALVDFRRRSDAVAVLLG